MRVGPQIGPWWPCRQDFRPLERRELPLLFANEVHVAAKPNPIDFDVDPVAVAQLTDRSAGECFRTNVPDTGPRTDTGESRVGNDGDFAPPGEVLQRRGDLVGFFHAGSHRSATGQDEHITRPNGSVGLSFDGRDGIRFCHENTSRPLFSVDAVRVDNVRVDGGRLHDGSVRANVSDREANRTGHTPSTCLVRRDNYLIWIDAVLLGKSPSQLFTPVARLPPLKDLFDGLTTDGPRL